MEKHNIKLPFTDRTEAGRLLGKALQSYANRPEVIVLALPRGGVPVGFEVAKALNAPLDLMLVRKLGVPGHRELAMGAIATGDAKILNKNVIDMYGISDETIDQVAAAEKDELQRRFRVYRDDLPEPDLTNRCVILVDDGVATGATIRAAVAGLRETGASEIVVAVPIGASDTLDRMRKEADQVISLAVPDMLYSIGQWYLDFSQVSDEEVCELLSSHSQKNDKQSDTVTSNI